MLAGGRLEGLVARGAAGDARARRSDDSQAGRGASGGFLSLDFFLTLYQSAAMLFVDGLVRRRDEFAEEGVQAFRVLRRLEHATGDAKEVTNIERLGLHFVKLGDEFVVGITREFKTRTTHKKLGTICARRRLVLIARARRVLLILLPTRL